MSYGFTLSSKQYNNLCYLNFQCHIQEDDQTPLTTLYPPRILTNEENISVEYRNSTWINQEPVLWRKLQRYTRTTQQGRQIRRGIFFKKKRRGIACLISKIKHQMIFPSKRVCSTSMKQFEQHIFCLKFETNVEIQMHIKYLLEKAHHKPVPTNMPFEHKLQK